MADAPTVTTDDAGVLRTPDDDRESLQPPSPQEEQALDIATSLLAEVDAEQSVLPEPDPEYSTWQTALGVLNRETWTGAAVERGIRQLEEGRYDYIDPGFDPYRHFVENEDTLGDVTDHVNRFGLDDIHNEQQFYARIGGWRRDLQNIERMQEGTIPGMLLGTGLSFFDISTLIPVAGQLKKGQLVRNVAKLSAYGAGLTTLQEAGLHSLQDVRSVQESILNIGVGTALGGGLGVFGTMAAKQASGEIPNELDLRNPVGETVVGHGQELSEGVVIRPVPDPGTDGPILDSLAPVRADDTSAGAAQAGPGSTDPLRNTGKVSKAVRKVGEFLGHPIPIVRNQARSSPVARRIIGSFYQTGAATQAATRSEGVQSAQWHKDAYLAETQGRLFTNHDTRLRELRAELGQTSGVASQHLRQQADRVVGAVSEVRGKPRAKSLNVISEADWNEAVKHQLFDHVPEEYRSALRADYGDEGAEKILAKARQMAEEIHDTNARVERELIDLGLLDPEKARGRDYRMAQLWDPKIVGSNKPAARRFFRDVLASRPSDEFLEAHEISRQDFDRLGKQELDLGGEEGVLSIEEGAALKDELLARWIGDEHDAKLLDLEDAVAGASRDLDEARRSAVNLAYALRRTTTALRDSTIAEVKRIRDAGHKRLEKYRTVALQAASEADQLRQAADAARRQSQARQFLPLSDASVRRPEVRNQPSLDRITGRLETVEKTRKKAIRRQQELSAQLQKIDEAIEAERLHKAQLKEMQSAIKAARNEARKARARNTTALKRLTKRLEKARKAPNLNARIDELVHTLSNGNRLEAGVLDDVYFSETGRLREREIELTPEQRLEAERLGILRDDLMGILERQYTELAGRMALRKAFRQESVGLSENEMFKDLAQRIEDDYERLADDARARGDEKQAAAYGDEARKAIDDLKNFIDYFMGRLGKQGNPESFLRWGSGVAKAFNFSRHGLEFIFSSFPDMALAAFTTGFRTLSPRNMRQVRKAVEGLSNSEVARLAFGGQLLFHHSPSAKQSNMDDLANLGGIGTPGSPTFKATSGVARTVRFMSEQVNPASGMAWWDSRLKMLASIEQIHNIHRVVNDYEAILAKAWKKGPDGDLIPANKQAALEISQLSSIGIGKAEAAKLRKVFEKYGIKPDEHGIVDLRMDEWLQEDGEMFHLMAGALRTTQDRVTPVPGAGEMPFMMSHPVAGMILQFQSHGFAIVNKFLAPAHQRIFYYKDMEAVLAAAFAAQLGLVTTMAKDQLRDGIIDKRNRSPREWVYDSLDRGGFLSYLAPYASAAQVLAGERGGSRYANVGIVGQLLGPSFGLATDVTTGVGAAASAPGRIARGETTSEEAAAEVAEKLRRISPYQTLWKLNDIIMGAEER